MLHVFCDICIRQLRREWDPTLILTRLVGNMSLLPLKSKLAMDSLKHNWKISRIGWKRIGGYGKSWFSKQEWARVQSWELFLPLKSGENLKFKYDIIESMSKFYYNSLFFPLQSFIFIWSNVFFYLWKIRRAKKFKHSDIKPTLCGKYDIMFTNLMATDKFACAPSQWMILGDVRVMGPKIHLMKMLT
jgi:hypothetical protein